MGEKTGGWQRGLKRNSGEEILTYLVYIGLLGEF